MGNDSIKTVAMKYNMHPSVLYRHSKGLVKSHGGQRALSLETEEYIIQYIINVCAEWGYPLDSLDLRYIFKMYLDKIGITHKRFRNNFPGPDFIQCFLNRHKDKISKRICQNIKSCFPKLLKKLMEVIQENAESNLKAGFKKTGIYPLDATQVLSRIPTQLYNSTRHREAVDESVLTLLNDMRYGTMGVLELKRKRKLDVVVGKSVSASTEDYVDSEVTPGPSTSRS